MRLIFAPKKMMVLFLAVLFFLPVTSPAAGLLESAGMETEKIELIVGKSLILKLGTPFKEKDRISIGSPEIANFEILSTSEIYIKGLSVGTTNLILWQGQKDRPLAIYDVEVSYDVSRLKEKLYQALPDETDIQVFSTNKTVTLLGKVSNNTNLSRALVLAKAYAAEGAVNNLLEVGGTHQIMLEVTVAEMSRSLGKDLGIDVSFFNESGDLGVINLGQLGVNVGASSISGAVTSFFQFSKGSATWTGFIQALQEDGLVKILSEPNLIALSGQSASFLAGGEYPIPVPSGLGETSIEFKEYGVGLNFTPFVLSPDRISIKVDTEVSELDFSTAVQFGGFVVPGVKTRRAATTIDLADGESFALAGLLSENVRENVKKFPFLGDIPILGTLFKSTAFQKNETELVIIATPRFIKPMDHRNITLPSDAYEEPDNAEIYLNINKEYLQPSSDLSSEGTLDGDFGHTFGPED
ncbi:MAG: type II and III secretion system protein family protein [Desulfotignum sp.]|nr:type II and III secretion system protein family protein [Desulfotignum sp.]